MNEMEEKRPMVAEFEGEKFHNIKLREKIRFICRGFFSLIYPRYPRKSAAKCFLKYLRNLV